eukprot:scaffold7052_cov254-Pinguiococcus_pyrenoidosus.AAC.86
MAMLCLPDVVISSALRPVLDSLGPWRTGAPHRNPADYTHQRATSQGTFPLDPASPAAGRRAAQQRFYPSGAVTSWASPRG